jgi:SAM-dependent methyltransferase
MNGLTIKALSEKLHLFQSARLYKSVFSHAGFCPLCEKNTTFSSSNEWFRDFLKCGLCKSLPRERALMQVIKMFLPNYRELFIHESSPANRGASPKLKIECPNYSSSQYFENVEPGCIDNKSGFRCENLEALTFDDQSFDLFITQDVMEHIFDPTKAFKEIARVLKLGGMHIFTVPIINKAKRSECWASLNGGEIVYHHEPEYHGNPVDSKGALVTMHWGYDIAEFIFEAASTPTTIVMIDNIDLGIRAEYIEVLISRKHLE